jgi:Xaa-Pro aminopeptidase
VTIWSDTDIADMTTVPGRLRHLSPNLVRAMTQGWSAPPLAECEWSGVGPRRTRRNLIAADFPGETLVIPNGGLTTRTNDLPFPFRPATDHMWLVGPTGPGSVLIIGPNGDETLYTPDHVQLGHPLAVVDPHGALYEGPRPSLSELSARLGIATEPLDSLEARLRETRSRAVRGLDPRVDAAVPDDDLSSNSDMLCPNHSA